MFLVLNGLLFIGSTVFVWGQTSCSRLLYSPSVFSLMIMISMFLWRVWTPGSDWQCITLAKRSKLVLFICKESEKKNPTTTTIGQFGDNHRRQAQSVIFKIFLVLLPEDVIPGLDRRRHGVFGFYVTYQGRSKGHIQLNCLSLSHISSWWISTHCFCVCDTDKTAPLAFEGDSVAADGHDGVVHVVVSLQRRVDVHHLEVHWDTAEPAKQTGKRHQEPSVTLMPSTSRQGLFWVFLVIPSNLKTSRTWLSSSGPIPSPGMSVTVCLPPYFAGGGCSMRLCREFLDQL